MLVLRKRPTDCGESRKTEMKFTEPVKLDLPSARFQFPLTHVSWSPFVPNSMLAVVDSAGHFALYTTSHAACRLNKTALMTFDGPDANAGCVTLHWLRNRAVS